MLKSFTMTMTTAELLEHLKKVLSVKTDAKLAEMLGMTAPALSMVKLRNSSIAENIVGLAEREGYDLNLLLLGRTQTKMQEAQGDLVLGEGLLKDYDLDRDNILIMPVTEPVAPLKIGDLVVLDRRYKTITSSGIYAIVTGAGSSQLRRVHVSIDGSLQIFATKHDPIEKFSPKQARQITTAGRAVLCLTQL